MIRLTLVLLFFISACLPSQETIAKRTFVVMDFCRNELVEYFSDQQVIDAGISFELIEYSRRLEGTEHLVGMAVVLGSGLTTSDLDSFINGALSKCHPNARVSMRLDDEVVTQLLSKTQVYGKKEGTNRIIQLKDGKLIIYSNYQ